MDPTTVLILAVSFALLLLVGVPVAFCIGISTALTLLLTVDPTSTMTTVAQRVATGLDSFALLAIPFFILAGQLMNRGGMARRLVSFAKSVLGTFPGGLAYVNVVAAMLFGAVSGSAVAAASGGVSIAALFLAGYLPGILVGLSLMAVAGVWAWRADYPTSDRVPLGETLRRFRDALPSLFMLVVVIGGIVAGIFTATEAAAIAVLYALVLAFVYREVTVKELPEIFLEAVETTAVVMLLIGTSIAMSWVLSYENIPQSLSRTLVALTDSRVGILLIINAILLVVGTFMDMTPAVLIFTPIFLPIVTDLGFEPVHFGIIMVLNLCVGLCTPPVGSVLFVGAAVADTTISRLVRPLLPLFLAMVVALLVVTFVPEVSLWLPRLFGF